MRLITRRPTSYSMFQGFTGIAEVFLELWGNALHHPKGTAGQEKYKHLVVQVMHQLQKFARIFSIGQPYALRFSGTAAWLSGSPGKAIKRWQNSLVTAESLQMPYETGLAHYELGRHENDNIERRQYHLEKAIQLFTKLDAVYDRTRAEIELGRLK